MTLHDQFKSITHLFLTSSLVGNVALTPSSMLTYVHSHERWLALCCLDILNSKLSEDVDDLLKLTEEISVLSKEAVLNVMPLEVQYACQFWAVVRCCVMNMPLLNPHYHDDKLY